jgi:hypothetical protein
VQGTYLQTFYSYFASAAIPRELRILPRQLLSRLLSQPQEAARTIFGSNFACAHPDISWPSVGLSVRDLTFLSCSPHHDVLHNIFESYIPLKSLTFRRSLGRVYIMSLSSLLERRAIDMTSTQQRNWMPEYALTIQIITTFLLWTRIISRFMTRGQVGFDDVLIFLAWILGTALTILVLLCKFGPPFVKICVELTDSPSHLQIWIQQTHMANSSRRLVEGSIGKTWPRPIQEFPLISIGCLGD